MAAGDNVNIDTDGNRTIITIVPLYRASRLISILPVLAISWSGMGVLAFAGMYGFDEGGGTSMTPWALVFFLLSFGAILHYLAAMLLASSFSMETLIVMPHGLRYRFSMFGLGVTREFEIEAAGVQEIPESRIGHGRIIRFFGLSKPRFLIRKKRGFKAICGDVDRTGATKIAEVLRCNGLLA